MTRLYLTGARMVLRDALLDDASVLIEDGIITAINPESGNGAENVDLRGKTLIPGMIDLHCDALEKEVEPRPNVYFPLDFACAQADKRNAAAGVTTVMPCPSPTMNSACATMDLPHRLPGRCMHGIRMAWSITGCTAATK